MDYQLVLQFSGDTLVDCEAMVALEDELTEELGDSADVDGHDFGSGTGIGTALRALAAAKIHSNATHPSIATVS